MAHHPIQGDLGHALLRLSLSRSVSLTQVILATRFLVRSSLEKLSVSKPCPIGENATMAMPNSLHVWIVSFNISFLKLRRPNIT
eukprot:CAMPEP_0176179256 /NCGR_PEP_ID=MMETSP0120_2-20121206/91846_1 /TAXON_ID=160619 /ORGANISM="Kryptoperidinium foliaceum, Strain CCMP 1326" /LENGTH=83 /DNA_ID=CAMNT_0017517425 /DNA_START=144 /DNA_END=395 /DNA_ORIENTATION=+